MADYYDILGVSRRATEAEITKAYRSMVMKYHPDQHEQNALRDLAEEKLKAVNEAHEVLSDPRRRRLYDAGVRSSMGGAPGPGGVPVQTVDLTRMVVKTAFWLIGLPILFRLSHNPQLFMALVAGFFAWRLWRRRRGRPPQE